MLVVLIAVLGAGRRLRGRRHPAADRQATLLVHHLPQYLHALQDHNSELGKLNDRFHIQAPAPEPGHQPGHLARRRRAGRRRGRAQRASPRLLVVLVLTIYFLADCPGSSCSCTGWPRTPGGPG